MKNFVFRIFGGNGVIAAMTGGCEKVGTQREMIGAGCS